MGHPFRVAVKETSDYRDKPQGPPLRFAPVGMTILLQGARYPLDLSVLAPKTETRWEAKSG
jgi:hypothetical protein